MKKKSLKVYSAVVLFTQLGTTMAIPIILGAIAGNYIDNRIGTKATFLIIFLLLGIAAGFTGSYRLIRVLEKKKDTEE